MRFSRLPCYNKPRRGSFRGVCGASPTVRSLSRKWDDCSDVKREKRFFAPRGRLFSKNPRTALGNRYKEIVVHGKKSSAKPRLFPAPYKRSSRSSASEPLTDAYVLKGLQRRRVFPPKNPERDRTLYPERRRALRKIGKTKEKAAL